MTVVRSMTFSRATAALAGLVLLGGGTSAVAQSQTEAVSVSFNAEVGRHCVMNAPDSVTVDLQILTSADGRLQTQFTGSSHAQPNARVDIDDLWCNAPSRLTVSAAPLSLIGPAIIGAASPEGFTRTITYDATVAGDAGQVSLRPIAGGVQSNFDSDAALSGALFLTVSNLEALDANGVQENPDLALEAGVYVGEVIVSLAVNP